MRLILCYNSLFLNGTNWSPNHQLTHVCVPDEWRYIERKEFTEFDDQWRLSTVLITLSSQCWKFSKHPLYVHLYKAQNLFKNQFYFSILLNSHRQKRAKKHALHFNFNHAYHMFHWIFFRMSRQWWRLPQKMPKDSSFGQRSMEQEMLL